MVNIILGTERLILRKFTINDAAFLIRLVNSPGWLEFIGDRNIKTTEQALDYLQNGPLKSYKEHGYGLCLVELKDAGTAIGMCGIIKREQLDNPDIGVAFLPEFTRKGYAIEIADAMMRYARNTLELPSVWAITVPENSASIKLLKKIGLTFYSNFSFPDAKEELLLFKN